MPTTSSYYNDLEYPTVNEDASTYGSIINTYLDGLLTKLKAISDRVTNAQTQLGNINRGVNSVERINTTLAGRIGSSALLPGTNITLLPDPYSGNYTKTTAWPAYGDALSAFDPPTTQGEIAAFDYQGFANALTTEVNRIEATVTQAEADILAAQKDTCRAKKYIDAYNNRTTEIVLQATQLTILNIGGSFSRVISSTQLLVWNVPAIAEVVTQYNLAGTYPLYGYGTSPARTSPASMNMEANFMRTGWPSVSNGGNVSNNFGMNSTPGSLTIYSAPVYYASKNEFFYQMLITLPAGYEFDTAGLDLSPDGLTTTSGQPYYLSKFPDTSLMLTAVSTEYVTRTTTPTVDLTECENPSPPYFS